MDGRVWVKNVGIPVRPGRGGSTQKKTCFVEEGQKSLVNHLLTVNLFDPSGTPPSILRTQRGP